MQRLDCKSIVETCRNEHTGYLGFVLSQNLYQLAYHAPGFTNILFSFQFINQIDRIVKTNAFADDLVVLIDAYPRHRWLLTAVSKRLREEFTKLQVEVNEEKSRTVDLACGESFSFLGLDFRSVISLKTVWRANYAPKLKKRKALLLKLKDIFRRFQSQPINRVIELINPILRVG